MIILIGQFSCKPIHSPLSLPSGLTTSTEDISVDRSLVKGKPKFKPASDFEKRVDRSLFKFSVEVFDCLWFNETSTDVSSVDRS